MPSSLQTPLQQSPSALQRSPPGLHVPEDATHVLAPPKLDSQRPEQHSADAEQPAPSALHNPVLPKHWPKSQRPEQHSRLFAQYCPMPEHVDTPPPEADALKPDPPA